MKHPSSAGVARVTVRLEALTDAIDYLRYQVGTNRAEDVADELAAALRAAPAPLGAPLRVYDGITVACEPPGAAHHLCAGCRCACHTRAGWECEPRRASPVRRPYGAPAPGTQPLP